MTSKIFAVRWMGAFGNPENHPHSTESLERVVLYELRNDDEVSVAIQTSDTQVGNAKIGLLVDLSKSSVHAIYAGDAWTIQLDNGALVATRSHKVKGTNPNCIHDRSWRGYDEAICRPEFVGIVVYRTANKKQRNSARLVAERVGLPYLGTLK